MAYPAELLAPTVRARAAGATDQGVSTGDPATLQRRVSEIRGALDEPFAPHARLADRMRRLPPWAGEPSKRVGGVFDGPASWKLDASGSMPPRTLFVGGDKARIAKEVESAMRAWKASGSLLDDAAIDAIVADVAASDAEPAPRSGELESLFRRARDRGYDAVVIDCPSGDDEALVRDAAWRARASRPRRCGLTSANGAARVALELVSLPGRGGQATTWPGAAHVQRTFFVGLAGGKGSGRRHVACVVDGDGVLLSGRSELWVVNGGDSDDDEPPEPEDEEGSSSSLLGSASLREWGARSVAAATTAVRVALECTGGEHSCTRLVVHHEGRSHPDFAPACVAAGRERGVEDVEVVDIVREPQAATGRILRWSKDAGVGSPCKGTHFALSDTDAACVTTEGGSGDSVPKPLLVRRRTRGGSSATALASEVVALARANARENKEENGGRVPRGVLLATRGVRWGREEDVEALPEAIRWPDVVLGADLMYTSDEGVIRALAKTTGMLVRDSGRVAVFAACREHRPESIELFVSIVETEGFTVRRVPASTVHPDYPASDDEFEILECWRR